MTDIHEQAVKLATTLFYVLRDITPNKDTLWHADSYGIAFQCLGTTPDPYIAETVALHGTTVLARPPFKSSEDAVEAFFQCFDMVMQNAGFTFQKGARIADLKEDEYTLGYARSLTSISAFSFHCNADPDKITKALSISRAGIDYFCSEAVSTIIKEKPQQQDARHQPKRNNNGPRF